MVHRPSVTSLPGIECPTGVLSIQSIRNVVSTRGMSISGNDSSVQREAYFENASIDQRRKTCCIYPASGIVDDIEVFCGTIPTRPNGKFTFCMSGKSNSSPGHGIQTWPTSRTTSRESSKTFDSRVNFLVSRDVPYTVYGCIEPQPIVIADTRPF